MTDLLAMSTGTLVVVVVVIAIGSFVQSVVGLGLGLVSAPFLTLVAPELVPTLLLMLAVPLSAAVTALEWRHINWRATAWALPARLPGTVLGVWLVTVFSHRQLGVAVAVRAPSPSR